MAAWQWFVYIIECKDGSYYTGRTWEYSDRYEQHLAGKGSKYTAKHGVKRLAYVEEFDDSEAAALREKQIQGWTKKRRKNLLMVNGVSGNNIVILRLALLAQERIIYSWTALFNNSFKKI